MSKIHSLAPVIATNDIEKTLSFYIETLGFTFDFKYGAPPIYAGVKSGDAELYFCNDHKLAQVIKDQNINPEIFIWVSNATELFEVHTKKGAEIIETIAERPWGAKQYVVKEVNGYHLKFAESI